MVLRVSLSSPTTPVAPINMVIRLSTVAKSPAAGARAFSIIAWMASGALLLAHDPLDFGHELALGRFLPEHEGRHGDDDRPGGERGRRVV